MTQVAEQQRLLEQKKQEELYQLQQAALLEKQREEQQKQAQLLRLQQEALKQKEQEQVWKLLRFSVFLYSSFEHYNLEVIVAYENVS